MDHATRLLIESIHRASGRCVLALTGGGAGAAAMLLEVPGASRTILEVVVPYDDQALTDFLGRRPEHSCSAETARKMAERAYSRARCLAPVGLVVGIGCTASLVTDRPKRGDHRFHVAVHASDSTVYSLTFQKDARDRPGEETIVDSVILNALAEALAIEQKLDLPLLPGETVHVDKRADTGPWIAFFRSKPATACVDVDGRITSRNPLPALLVPGAFNPLHEAHCALADVAGQIVGVPAAFELSVTNVDKPPLGSDEIKRRVVQFAWKAPVWLTRAPTFIEKAAIFPGAIFAVGADTAVRVVDPRYYGNSAAALEETLAEIRARSCRFLVAGRSDPSGRFLELKDLPVPPAFHDLFEAIPEELFRVDQSSTLLRTQLFPTPSAK